MPDHIRPAPRLAPSRRSLAATYRNITSCRALLRQGVRAAPATLAAACRAMLQHAADWWREIQPGLRIDRHNFIERWDGDGEGCAWCFAFEGLGVTWTLLLGRTPRPRANLSSEERATWAR